MPSTQYLFLFTIGPVQSFIAQARKTRDLYAGSAILGDIIDASIKEVQCQNSFNKILVPDPDLKAKPNRFLAIISTNDLKKFCKDVELSAQAKWVSITLQTFSLAGLYNLPVTYGFDKEQNRNFELKALANIKPAEVAAQINNFLECYWVALPYDQVKDNYLQKHDELQQRLAAIKNTRQFDQINEPAARKCSLDGERNALYYRPLSLEKGDLNSERKNKYLQADALLSSQFMDIGEGLSAVSMVKRGYTLDQLRGFPSTAKVALLNVIDAIDESNEGIEFSRLLKSNNKLNEQLYFSENLEVKYFRNFFGKNEADDFIKKLPAIRDLQKKISDKHGKQMSKYYAILVFDGDSMGKIWSGNNPDPLMEYQARTSKRLQVFQELLGRRLGIYAAYAKAYLDGNIPNFADEIKDEVWRIVLEDSAYQSYFEKLRKIQNDVGNNDGYNYLNTKKGQSVYAGGDDFLGFINLNYLFGVIKELREAYDALVSIPLATEFDDPSIKLTFSAGIAVAHYKMPLHEVLKWSRLMEHEAKMIDEKKDAFAIAVLKHSGEIESTRYKWIVSDGIWLTDDMDYLIRQLQAKKISNNFIKTLGTEFCRISDSNGAISSNDLVHVEVKRLVKRSLNREPGETIEAYNKRTKIMIEHVQRLFYEAFTYNSVTGRKQTQVKSLSTFLSALNICDFIKRETAHEHE